SELRAHSAVCAPQVVRQAASLSETQAVKPAVQGLIRGESTQCSLCTTSCTTGCQPVEDAAGLSETQASSLLYKDSELRAHSAVCAPQVVRQAASLSKTQPSSLLYKD